MHIFRLQIYMYTQTSMHSFMYEVLSKHAHLHLDIKQPKQSCSTDYKEKLLQVLPVMVFMMQLTNATAKSCMRMSMFAKKLSQLGTRAGCPDGAKLDMRFPED